MLLVLFILGLIVVLAFNLACLVLPVLIVLAGKDQDKNRRWVLIGLLIVALPTAVASDWCLIASFQGWARSGFS